VLHFVNSESVCQSVFGVASTNNSQSTNVSSNMCVGISAREVVVVTIVVVVVALLVIVVFSLLCFLVSVTLFNDKLFVPMLCRQFNLCFVFSFEFILYLS
jgi:hypothetical protein